MSKTIITTRVDPDIAAELDRLAGKLNRSRGWVIARAVEEYVTRELVLLDSLDEAEAQIDRGEYYTQEQMEQWFAERRSVDRAA